MGGRSVHSTTLFGDRTIIMRRASEASFFFLGFPREKKPPHNGSYEHRLPKIKNKTFFSTRDVCVIQHRDWPLRSTILNAHVTNASPDGFCTRKHTKEALSCCFCCNSFRVDRARHRNVCLSKACSPTDQPVRKFKDGLGINMTMKTFFTLTYHIM